MNVNEPHLLTNYPPDHSQGKIRVLKIITQLAMGGGTKVALDIASHLSNHPGFDVHMISGPIADGYTDVMYLAYEKKIPLQVLPSLINHINPIANIKAVAELRNLILCGNYEIVHTHTKVAGVVGRLAARAAKTPVIVHHVHGWGSPEEMATGKRVLYLWLERLCARFTNRIITVSKLDMQKGLANRIGKRDKFSLIYNGIDLEKYRICVDEQQLRDELGLEKDSKLVGMIGRLDKQKNPLDFIKAAALVAKAYPKVQFLMVGDGSLLPYCVDLIKSLDLQNKVFLLGYRQDVASILSILTITALSSLWEGLPIVFQESMSAGKPIVANDVDGAREVVKDWETGFLVRPQHPEDMADRILFLLNNDELCRDMGRVGQERSNQFSLQNMLQQIESLYQELYPNGTFAK